MKIKALVLSLAVVAVLFSGCAKKADTQQASSNAASKTDAVTSASIVNEAGALEKALSKDGTWIVATLNDLETDKELVVEGEFHDKGDTAKDIYRKLAPYTQDENHKVTGRFTITAPKMTVKSPNFKLQGGTFKGDVYVEANGFTVQDATVDGNIYFASQEYKDSFVLPTEEGKAGKVTGTMEVKK